MKLLAWLVLIIGIVISFMISFAEGSSETPFHLLGGLLFNLFVISPLVFLFVRIKRTSNRWLPQLILLIGALGITGFGLAIYYDAFVIATKRDAQDAILFFMVPAFQWLGAVIVAGLARLFDRGARATTEASSGTPG